MKNKTVLLILLIAVILAGIVFAVFRSSKNSIQNYAITNFDECAKAGYPIMESYPAQCRTESGELFVQKIDDTTYSSAPKPTDRVASGYVAGHVDIGPFCPVEREDEPCKIPPEAYSSRMVIVYESDGSTVNVTGKIDGKGDYNIPLNPGKYFIQIEPAGIRAGEKQPVVIKSFETSRIDFDIDTGIR